MGKEYVDMGLPSGTLWASENEEGYFTFDEALEKFGNNFPARWQLCELIDNCYCVFDSGKKALICKSRLNGNTIELPALGYRRGEAVSMYGDSVVMHGIGSRGDYLSYIPYINYGFGHLYFNISGNIEIGANYYSSDGQSVRLCKLEKNGIK